MWRTVLDLVLPRTCPGCGTAEPWCPRCAAALTGRPRQVRMPLTADIAGLPVIYALAAYRGPVRAAILAAKEHGRRDLPALLGAALGAGLTRLAAIAVISTPIWLVPAPTRPAVARARGGDPITLVARSAAALLAEGGTACGVAPCLFTGRGARDSVGLSAADRVANLHGRIGWRARAGPPPAAAVVLIDDVVTTGATAVAATAALLRQGHRVQAVVTLAAAVPLAPRERPFTSTGGTSGATPARQFIRDGGLPASRGRSS